MKIGKWVIVVMYCLLVCQEVYAATIISPEDMEKWFYPRLPIALFIGIISSGIAFFWVTRIKYKATEVSIDFKVITRFATVFIFALLISLGFLIADVASCPFDAALRPKEALLEVVGRWQLWGLIGSMLLSFWIPAFLLSSFCWDPSKYAFRFWER